ncbi:hypothetical protein GWK48_00035 [Metallosphaera tengchongensis]|uniref:Uncharacterized protein n=1 Tax=Metallosphaera tengchongensis TaxID=1532350 RepID=A0A6N0NSC2_9CREN|nr:hypothetical protein [Metallosphaera tengchongensis]QKQ98996.1 hypothetical protein GWK48_00035 [Metallosphaera tengchongensis]
MKWLLGIALILAVVLSLYIYPDLVRVFEVSHQSEPYPSGGGHFGVYVDNRTVYLVYNGSFGRIVIGNQTFMHGGPIMAGYSDVYLVENNSPLPLGKYVNVDVFNGYWTNMTFPVFFNGPGPGIPRSVLYPAGEVMPL